MFKVWFDFGDGPKMFEEKSMAELDAFIAGVMAAADGLGIDDYTQFDTEVEVAEYLETEVNDAK